MLEKAAASLKWDDLKKWDSKLIRELDVRYKGQFEARLPTCLGDFNQQNICHQIKTTVTWRMFIELMKIAWKYCCFIAYYQELCRHVFAEDEVKPVKLSDTNQPNPFFSDAKPADVLQASDFVLAQKAPARRATGTKFNYSLFWFYLEQDKTPWCSLLTSIGLPETQTPSSCLFRRSEPAAGALCPHLQAFCHKNKGEMWEKRADLHPHQIIALL